MAYNPKGLFSFEFVTPQGRLLTEMFFLLAPDDYTIQEGYKVSIRKKLVGVHVDDFGNDMKTISLSGEIYSLFEGQAGVVTLDGNSEFRKLRYALSRFRDFVNGQHIRNSITTLDTSVLESLSERETRWDNLICIYHDYDDDNHYQVIFENFSMSRSKGDPHTIRYSIQMRGIEDLSYSPPWKWFDKLKKWNPLGIVNVWYGIFQTYLSEVENLSATVKSVLDAACGLVGAGSFGAFIEQVNGQIANATNGLVRDVVQPFVDVASFYNRVFSATDSSIVEGWHFYIPRQLCMTNGVPPDAASDPEFDMTSGEELAELFTAVKLMEQVGNEFASFPAIDKIMGGSYTTGANQLEINQPIQLSEEDFTNHRATTQETVGTTEFNRLLAMYYEVKGQDTPSSIALAVYGDAEYANQILLANDVSNEDFESGTLIGKVIILPGKAASAMKADAPVYSPPIPPTASIRERLLYAHGIDIYLDGAGNLEADGSGDLQATYGTECLADNLLDRLQYEELNDLHPTWGLRIPIGEVPSQAMIPKMRREVLLQILDDPRVRSASISSLTIEGDVMNLSVDVVPFVGQSQILEAEVSLRY